MFLVKPFNCFGRDVNCQDDLDRIYLNKTDACVKAYITAGYISETKIKSDGKADSKNTQDKNASNLDDKKA